MCACATLVTSKVLGSNKFQNMIGNVQFLMEYCKVKTENIGKSFCFKLGVEKLKPEIFLKNKVK